MQEGYRRSMRPSSSLSKVAPRKVRWLHRQWRGVVAIESKLAASRESGMARELVSRGATRSRHNLTPTISLSSGLSITSSFSVWIPLITCSSNLHRHTAGAWALWTTLRLSTPQIRTTKAKYRWTWRVCRWRMTARMRRPRTGKHTILTLVGPGRKKISMQF